MSYINQLVDIHIASAVISIAGFIYRWQLALRRSPLLNHPILKIAPHIIDTVLLVSGIWMCVLLGSYPFVQNWLTAKVVLLVVYIVLGTFAIKRAKTARQRALFGIAAIIVFALIMLIAYNPWLV